MNESPQAVNRSAGLKAAYPFMICLLVLCITLGVSIHANSVENSMEISIIPKPQTVTRLDGVCNVDQLDRVLLTSFTDEVRTIGEILRNAFVQNVGREIPFAQSTASTNSARSIVLIVERDNPEIKPEGYELEIQPDGITVTACDGAGLLYGVETLRQLIESRAADSPITIPCVKVEDHPEYPWRGVLLDCCRHFLTKDFIKRYIDLLAYHKLNVLHLHLTDDQGWRIEIQKYPKLTEIGAYRGEVDSKYGGYYTQEDLREIVEYAGSRHIRVVPEFEMPGHASAAIASYPYLSCHGKPIKVQTEWGVFEDVFCPGKESTFEFLEGVLEEIIEIFPSQYIHIGGDEAPRKNWENCPHCQKRIEQEGLDGEDELQSYLIQRIGRFLAKHNRRLIGWDEILKGGGGLPEGTVVQSWRGTEGAIEGSKLGYDVILSPNQFVYFDYPQIPNTSKPKWMRVTPLEKVYSFDLALPELDPEQLQHILGAECTMWTEHAPQDEVDRQLFPRVCAFTEIVWTAPEKKKWDDFKERLSIHTARLRKLGVDFFEAE